MVLPPYHQTDCDWLQQPPEAAAGGPERCVQELRHVPSFLPSGSPQGAGPTALTSASSSCALPRASVDVQGREGGSEDR